MGEYLHAPLTVPHGAIKIGLALTESGTTTNFSFDLGGHRH